MNSIIEKELSKVKVADLSNFDEKTNTFIIKKSEKEVYNINECYIIKLDNSLTTMNGNQSLVYNWNRGTYPRYQYLKVEVSKVMSNMIYVNSIGYDNESEQDINVVWNGWLPVDNIKTIKKL